MTNRQLFLSHVAQTSTAPLMLEIERAEGMYMYDAAGKRYMDLIAGISVSNLGHSHPAVVEAVKNQAEKYMHLMVYGEFVESPQVKFAKQITDLLPASLNNVYFTNSGAEATEGAMKLAKRLTGRSRFISFQNSYHGSTQGALSLMGDEYFKQKFRPLLPDTLQLPYNQIGELEKITCRTAAVFLEPIQAESGITVPDRAFMQALRQRCTDTGTLLVLDEAQTGLGRTGKMFAFEHFDIVPDILLLAKALGGGMPLGAFVASKERMATLSDNPVLGHITTFGGHPVSCAAGLAALQVTLHENILEAVEAKSRLFKKRLVHPSIRSVRSMGLMLSLQFDSYEQNKQIIDRCISHGLLTDWFLFAPHCLRIAPPLLISEEEIKTACDIILRSIDETGS
ncbi:MAG: aspartate aminotransferase family protein [Bacteroidetes bacterium]|nr:aspartate aminotransferase family protein [Bacteroidota bacterium]